jgi:hypothetical protein
MTSSFRDAAWLGLGLLMIGPINSAFSAWIGASSGYNMMSCEVATLALDDGHSLMTIRGKGLVVTKPGSPDHMSHID